MINPLHRQAEETVDREEQQKRESKIARLQADLEVKAQSRQAASQMAQGRADFFAEEENRVRKQLIETFGEVAEQINLRLYHLLSLEGRRRCFLFQSRDRLEDASIVVDRGGLGVDGYEDHIPVLASDLADRWGGQILAVEPTDEEIFTIARRLDEQAKKAART